MIEIAGFIDHTNLKPAATVQDIEALCREAVEWRFRTVCVNSANVQIASKLLSGTGVGVCSVVGFPLGASLSGAKIYEAVKAHDAGASEIDMVLNIAWLKQGYCDWVEKEIRSLVRAIPDCTVKVILETCLLDDVQKRQGCAIIKSAGAHFAKTSTGFSSAGATVEDIKLMRDALGPDFGVKASGGIRDYETAAAMIQAGANRLGTSNSVAICKYTEDIC